MRILVACHNLVLAGGLLRFERLGRALKPRGHDLAFVVFDPEAAAGFQSDLPVHTLEESVEMSWDATIVPGAGFPAETIAGFSVFREGPFGARIQMILNDQTKRTSFLRVNESFQPDIVIFNNVEWPVGSFRDFAGKRFHQLIGAVDTTMFRPGPPTTNGRFVIGASEVKNPLPSLSTLELLPKQFCVRFIGRTNNNLRTAAKRLADEGRVEFLGAIFDEDLAQFYRELDAVVSIERFAGWANMVAEAMATGIPVVTTPHGTRSIAIAEETALVIDSSEPEEIAAALQKLAADEALGRRLAEAGRRKIERFDWSTYTEGFLSILQSFDGDSHYIACPEYGMYGKTAPSERFEGLAGLLDQAEGKSVLDLGAAEGLIAKAFFDHGAAYVDAYELEQSRVEKAICLFQKPGVTFACMDLSDAGCVSRLEAAAPSGCYDIVLNLGLLHHLAPAARMRLLTASARLAKEKLAIRTPVATFESTHIQQFLEQEGFVLESHVSPDLTAFSGPIWIFSRAVQ